MNPQEVRQLYDVITASIEGNITPEQFERLKGFLCNHPEAVDYYIDYITILSHLRSYDLLVHSFDQDQDSFDTALWEQLGEHEKTAPAVALPRAQPAAPPEMMHTLDRLPSERKISKTSIFSLIVSAVAILFLVLFARFAPPKSGIHVATLKDSLNARWAEANSAMRNGTRLKTGSELLLIREGFATLVFDNDATVVMEGPAEFQILTSDQIKLNYGRLYAIVPPQAYGFQVTTPSAKIIDLGTEFGVQQDMHGNTELHVVRGKTSLVSGVQGSRINVYVEAGTAKRLDVRAGQIENVACDTTLFARHIDSDTQFVWRGQNKLDLADIVGGGNGLGSGAYSMSIDPTSGKPSGEQDGRRGATNDFRPVAFNPFIDGVFVPNGQSLQIVSSQGHLFRECPETTGLTCENIINVTTNLDFLATQTRYVSDASARAILMHANMGITFDLQAMRGLLKGVDIQRFQSQFGIRRYAVRPDASNADFWVLVDGKLKFKKEHVKIGQLHFLDIELSEDDRFLTLVITEGDDPETRFLEERVLTAIDSDWGMFMEPVLVLKYAD